MTFEIFMDFVAVITWSWLCFYFGYYYGKVVYRTFRYIWLKIIRLFQGRYFIKPKGITFQ